MSYQKVPLLRKPTRPLPAMDHSDTTDKWYWYPSLANGVDAHTQCILHYNCQLTQINGDMCWLLFDKANKPTHTEIGRAAIDIHARLLEWHNTLPDCLAVTKDKPLPQMLTLQYVSAVQR